MAVSKPGGWKTRIIPETGAAGEAKNDTGGGRECLPPAGRLRRLRE
jgi:hypothetical protein